ncbi:MAG: hypothetical protein ACREJM_07835 [Candidatus Saccharimonadales bacterium]
MFNSNFKSGFSSGLGQGAALGALYFGVPLAIRGLQKAYIWGLDKVMPEEKKKKKAA